MGGWGGGGLSCLAASCVVLDVDPDASGASCSFADPLRFHDGNDASDRGDKESPSLGKADSSKAFCEVVSLITGFFPEAKHSGSSSVDFSPWSDNFGVPRRHDPCVFLSVFDKLALVKKDIEEKFC